jgi:DNA-binding MarR family transcriptional regulator
MSAEYVSNHYVPQWYQRQFIPAGQGDRELVLLDLKPEWFRDGKGVRRRRKALRRTGTRRCFAIDDLYTARFGGVESRELERVFFGEIDSRGKQAVEYFAQFDHDSARGPALEDLMMFMSTQKLRTPKGMDWLLAQAGAGHRGDILDRLPSLRSLYGAIWAECVWQIADASGSPTKLIVSDHPVTVYNRSCAPGNPLWSKGPNDPDIRLHATHTLFPLSDERLFDPHQSLLWRTTLYWQRQIQAALRPHDLTHVQFVLLASGWWLQGQQGEPTQAEIAQQAATDPMMTSQVLRRLETRKLLKRRPDPTDSRARRIALTAAGRRLLAQALTDVEAVYAAFFGPLGSRKSRLLKDLGDLNSRQPD